MLRRFAGCSAPGCALIPDRARVRGTVGISPVFRGLRRGALASPAPATGGRAGKPCRLPAERSDICLTIAGRARTLSSMTS